jgi:enoyl-[acyl-carrier protein] reductase II
MEIHGASREAMIKHLGKGRAKKGMFEGDLENGELEIGQVSAAISDILPVREVMNNLVNSYRNAMEDVSKNKF